MTLSADGDADRGNTQANVKSTALAARFVDGPRLSDPDKAAQRLADWLTDLSAGQAAAIDDLFARIPRANAILLGIVTHDANLLIIEPRKNRKRVPSAASHHRE